MPRKTLTQLLFALPAVIVFVLFFAAPFSYFLVVSFWRLRLFKLRPDFVFENYVGVFENYLYPLGFTFCIALLIALFSSSSRPLLRGMLSIRSLCRASK